MATVTMKGMLAGVAAALTIVGAAEAGALDQAGVLKMTPRHGVSFDVGSKRAISYYLGEGGICKLTVLVTDKAVLDEIQGAAMRVTIPVIPTRTARVDTAEGKTLEFKCAPSASAMSVSVLDRVAYAAPRK
ncbi:MAG: hypothetical protein AB7E80_04720 [Hyphomicrobiaceae bacterium]